MLIATQLYQPYVTQFYDILMFTIIYHLNSAKKTVV